MLILAIPFSSFSQRPARDKEKEKQWKSMENGPWDFAPRLVLLLPAQQVFRCGNCLGNGRLQFRFPGSL